MVASNVSAYAQSAKNFPVAHVLRAWHAPKAVTRLHIHRGGSLALQITAVHSSNVCEERIEIHESLATEAFVCH